MWCCPLSIGGPLFTFGCQNCYFPSEHFYRFYSPAQNTLLYFFFFFALFLPGAKLIDAFEFMQQHKQTCDC